MKEFKDLADQIAQVAQVIEDTTQHWADSIPIYTRQHIQTEATRKLNSTRNAYMSAINMKIDGTVMVVEIDPKNWLANAAESGLDPFNMKQGLLNGRSAKVSKQGYRYASIPIGKSRDNKPQTEKGQMYQEKFEALFTNKNTLFGPSKMKADLASGKVREMQQLQTEDPFMKGFYRHRSFDNAMAAQSKGRGKPAWQYVMFRMVSENPNSKSKWDHPGIKPVNIMRSTEQWLHEFAEDSLEKMLEEALAEMGK